MAMHMHLGNPPSPARLRLAAIALLTIPAGVLLLFAFGEMIGGDPSGAQHIPEGAALLLLAAAAWRYPLWTGVILLAVGAVLLLAWLLFVVFGPNRDVPAIALVATGAILFLPPFAAGWLLIRSSREA